MLRRLVPKKSLGQVFLVDPNLLSKVASLANVKDQVVVEIGAGDGRLTELVAREAKLVFAVELDEALFAELKRRFSEADNVIPICRDARRLRLAEMVRDAAGGKKVAVVGNLPYCSLVPIVRRLMRQLEMICKMCIMAQKELADRLVARPGTSEYGRLSVFVQVRCKAKRLMTVPRTAFWPRPEVDSVLLQLVPRRQRFDSPDQEEMFEKLVAAAFAHRRKTLRNSLACSPYFSGLGKALEILLDSSGGLGSSRAQELSADEFLTLAGELVGYAKAQRCGRGRGAF